MTQETKKIGNIKEVIGLTKDKVLSDVLNDYVSNSDIISDIADANTNTKILGAKATKDAIDNKASALDIPTKVSDLTNDVPYLTSSDISNKVDKVTGKGLSTEDFTSEEKTKLANIDAEANKYVHPIYDSHTKGLYKIAVDNTGHVNSVSEVTKADITGLGIPSQDTTYGEATTSTAGLMSASDKSKLNGLSNVTVDSELSSSSENPVQNKVVNGLATRLSALETSTVSIEFISTGEDLPQTGVGNKIYFVESDDSETENEYDEFVWTGTSWEKVGTKTIDLTGYARISELKNYINMSIDSNGDVNLIFTY